MHRASCNQCNVTFINRMVHAKKTRSTATLPCSALLLFFSFFLFEPDNIIYATDHR